MNVSIRRTANLDGVVQAPPSKSYTQRMVLAAALAEGVSNISKPLFSEDTEATVRAVRAFGAIVKINNDCWTIEGNTYPKAAKQPIDCGESGATLRFMIPVAALADGPSTLVFKGSLKRRTVEPLLKSLQELGAPAYEIKLGNRDAVFVKGGGIAGGQASIPGDVSSQFISGLMFACPLAEKPTEITLSSPLESEDYVKMTQYVLSKHTITIEVKKTCIAIPPNQAYKAADDKVPGDFSSAAFLFAAAAITTSNITIKNLDYKVVQGDKAILNILKKMGVNSSICTESVEIQESKELKPINVDTKNTPDLVPAIAALACYANGKSTISGARRLKIKESDRLQSLHSELSKMGAQITLTDDGLIIKGGTPLHGATIDPHNDHRIAMACTVAALGADGTTTIKNAECIRKSYPEFFNHLKQLGVDLVGGKFDR